MINVKNSFHNITFFKRFVDSSDLPLNVSREMIQKDQHIKLIQKALVSKILRYFKNNFKQR